MKRRNFIIGTGSAAIGGSALLGTGAFSRVESHRAVTVNVAEDPDAYLGLDGCPDSPNSSYTDIDDHGHLAIDMTSDNPTDAGGEGVNSDSRTWFDRVFQVCNQGKEDICVYIEDDEDWPVFEDNGDERRVEFYLEDDRENSIIGIDNAVPVALGECICIGLRTTTKDLSEGDSLLEELDNQVNLVADTALDCTANGPETCAEITAEYTCTIEEDGEFIGTRYTTTNDGPNDVTFGWAILGEPDVFRDATRVVEGNDERTFVTDTTTPEEGVVWFQEECDEPINSTWGELKDGDDVSEDLIDEFDDDIPDDAFAVVIDGLPVTDDNREICD